MKPLSPWRRGDLAYWGQMCSLLQHVASRAHLSTGAIAHLRAKATDLKSRWQDLHGPLIDGDDNPITLLIKGAECNKDQAQKLALGRQAEEYQNWLSQATLGGHSGIYKCLRAPDAVHVRPFRNVPVQQRQQLREAQYGMWQVVDTPKVSGERERLRYEGIAQARQWEDLDPSHSHEESVWPRWSELCAAEGTAH